MHHPLKYAVQWLFEHPELDSHHHHQFRTFLWPLWEKPFLSIPPNPFSFSIDLLVLDISCHWSQVMWSLCLVSFTQHHFSMFICVVTHVSASFIILHLCICTTLFKTCLVAQTVKHLPTMRETWVRFLGWEDPLEKEMATHSSTLARKIPWMEEPGRLQSVESQRVGHN